MEVEQGSPVEGEQSFQPEETMQTPKVSSEKAKENASAKSKVQPTKAGNDCEVNEPTGIEVNMRMLRI